MWKIYRGTRYTTFNSTWMSFCQFFLSFSNDYCDAREWDIYKLFLALDSPGWGEQVYKETLRMSCLVEEKFIGKVDIFFRNSQRIIKGKFNENCRICIWFIKPRRVSKSLTITGPNSHHKIWIYGDVNLTFKGTDCRRQRNIYFYEFQLASFIQV